MTPEERRKWRRDGYLVIAAFVCFGIAVVIGLVCLCLLVLPASASAQGLSTPTNLTATAIGCVDETTGETTCDCPECPTPCCVGVTWDAYDWQAVTLAGGEEYGFDLERSMCVNFPECTQQTVFEAVYTPRFIALLGDCAFEPYTASIDVIDVLYAQDIALGVAQPKPVEVNLCDVDCTGGIDLFDVLLLSDDVLGASEIPMECAG